jgi:hypothetical protein
MIHLRGIDVSEPSAHYLSRMLHEPSFSFFWLSLISSLHCSKPGLALNRGCRDNSSHSFNITKTLKTTFASSIPVALLPLSAFALLCFPCEKLRLPLIQGATRLRGAHRVTEQCPTNFRLLRPRTSLLLHPHLLLEKAEVFSGLVRQMAQARSIYRRLQSDEVSIQFLQLLPWALLRL